MYVGARAQPSEAVGRAVGTGLHRTVVPRAARLTAMRRALFLSAVVLAAIGCASDGDADVALDPMPPTPFLLDPALARFARGLEGSFATADGRERLDALRVWPEREGLWMFVQRRSAPGEPARLLEVWSIELRDDTSLAISVHDLPEPAHEFQDPWRKEVPLASIGPKDLTPRPERALTLLDRGDSFQGGRAHPGRAPDLRLVVGRHRVLWQAGDATDPLSFERLR